MGELMRQYWLPAAKSSEVVADGAPLRLMLLGEKLIAYRDSVGNVGVMDHRCPHRCASLFFARNEGGGIRCVYHGWKFDKDGNCIEMPNVPPEQDFKGKVKAKAYTVEEKNGLIWVFMGDKNSVPPLPGIEPTLLEPGDIRIIFAMRECNWLQALEGDIDTSHFSWLHAGSIGIEQVPSDNHGKYQIIDRAPEYHVRETEWGTMYGAYRETDNPDQL
ncbi:MAG: Rieske 2Fe-2S domain-containing protein, partial [Rhodospirillales bacterium]|nr:Rieske 2Fe-2S domain-containing protein [Rhodospirillales bacterium]